MAIIAPIDDDRNKCNQDECPDTPTTIVYWPGRTPPPRYCDEHAMSAKNVLAAMGCDVHTALIGDDGEPFHPSLRDA